MDLTSRTIFIISGDPVTAQGCIGELEAFGGRYRTPFAASVDEARRKMGRSAPAAVFLDESAIGFGLGDDTLESSVALLSETAPVVVAAAPEKQAGMAFLITSGAVDFVARTGRYLPIVAGMLDRRVRMAERVTGMVQFSRDELSGDWRNSPPRSEQPTDWNSRQHRAAPRAARSAAALCRRAPGDNRGTRRAVAGNRSAPLQRVGRAARAR
jgi:hypothetical protein